MTETVEREGVEKFEASFTELLDSLEREAGHVGAGLSRTGLSPPGAVRANLDCVEAPIQQPEGNVPEPDSERGAWAVALVLGLLGVAVLVLGLSGVLEGSSSGSAAAPGGRGHADACAGRRERFRSAGCVFRNSRCPARARGASLNAIVGDPSPTQAHRDLALYEDPTSTHIAESWMQGFYPIYATAQKTFGVNWLLLASIHRQESAFSTAPGIYHGLNFAGCCGGPMQFNVTNGPITTWALVSDSYRYGARPASYDHMTAKHPSIYDDFDAIMAAAHLLSADGASTD